MVTSSPQPLAQQQRRKYSGSETSCHSLLIPTSASVPISFLQLLNNLVPQPVFPLHSLPLQQLISLRHKIPTFGNLLYCIIY